MVAVFLIGVLVALLFEEFTDLRPGGIIVPGFLALSLQDPVRIAATLSISLVTVLITIGVGRLVLLYGQRRFAFNLLTGATLKAFLVWILPAFFLLSPGLLVIGYVIPGIIAECCQRQGIGPTLLATLAATGITGLVLLVMGGA